MFGADLFGDPKARAMDYPVLATAEPGAGLEPSWTAHDTSEIWTMTNLGSLCADRGGATQAVARGKGWDWVFGGGTAGYAAKAVVDPPNREPYRAVQPVDTGNAGAIAQVIKRSDVAIADHECPVIADENWEPQLGRASSSASPRRSCPSGGTRSASTSSTSPPTT